MSLRAFSTLGCPELALDEAIALAQRHGIEAIELRALGGSLDLPAQLKAEFGSPESLAGHLRAGPVRIVALDTSLRLISAGAADRAAFLEYVPWAEALGVARLRVFDGARTGDSAELVQAGAAFRWWQELRRERGWRTDLMVETHDAVVTTPLIRRFVAAAPGISLLWDAHHTWKVGGEDPLATWAAIQPHVCHIHIKDSVSAPSAKHAYTYVAPGAGEFPAAPLLAALRRDDFAGPVSLEWERVWHPYLASLDSALASATANSWW
jgi:sugar phosphate isomerase/epimerase